MPRIINVSNRLPVTVGDTIERSSGGLITALEGLASEGYQLQWIGWPGSAVEPDRQPEVERILTREYGCTPVFLDASTVEGFYEGFSNAALWPLLHYMPTRFRYESGWWDQYQRANRLFADKVLSVAREEDLVWVHDYHLMLLPAMLREARPTLRIGFFLHTPFPSYEVFRCHPRRRELLEGLLGADQIGFHTFGYLRHFGSAVLRLLGFDSEMMRIRHDGHTLHMGIYPIGINAPGFAEELQSPRFAEQLGTTRAATEGKRVVISVERLDYTKGLPQRLDAIDLFLSEADDRERIKFIVVSVPSRENVAEYQLLRDEVEGRIGRINGKYATLHESPVHFIHSSISFTELCALYAIADVGMVTPLIDGMNLVAKEYVACQREEAGALVLSEFAGAAEELFNAILVNPYDVRGVADALRQALAMSPDERRARMRPMRQRIMRYDARAWARSFLGDLQARDVSTHVPPPIDEARQRLRRALAGGQRVALFLDYDGTLREIERDPAAAWPNQAVHHLLEKLRQCPQVEVTIVSGRTAEDLELFLGRYPFGLIAEHGASLRRPGQQDWEQLDRGVNYAWKDELLKVLTLYEHSTPGSFVENKRTSLVWHYRQADPQFGTWKANELANELALLTANEPVQVRHGRKIVEIAAASINKGAAVARSLEQREYDLVLLAGDDETDESMFRLDAPSLVSVKVGEGDTQARYRIRTPAAFRRFLEEAMNGGR